MGQALKVKHKGTRNKGISQVNVVLHMLFSITAVTVSGCDENTNWYENLRGKRSYL